ncbi:MAG: sigma-70 family RNA polymerase sigma factor [Planctomycetota bacterium]|nr:sigma-70 family RNA polymerase sigma factor [Planctomycetota bacterium]
MSGKPSTFTDPNLNVTELANDGRTEAWNLLAEPTLRAFCKKIHPWLIQSGLVAFDISAEELFNELWVGQMRTAMAKMTFENRQAFLGTYVKHAIWAAMRHAKTTRSHRSKLHMLATSDARPGIPIAQSDLTEPEQIAEHHQLAEKVNAVIAGLNSDAQLLIDEYFFQGKSLHSIGKEHGISGQAVHKRLTKLLEQLRSLT